MAYCIFLLLSWFRLLPTSTTHVLCHPPPNSSSECRPSAVQHGREKVSPSQADGKSGFKDGARFTTSLWRLEQDPGPLSLNPSSCTNPLLLACCEDPKVSRTRMYLVNLQRTVTIISLEASYVPPCRQEAEKWTGWLQTSTHLLWPKGNTWQHSDHSCLTSLVTSEIKTMVHTRMYQNHHTPEEGHKPAEHTHQASHEGCTLVQPGRNKMHMRSRSGPSSATCWLRGSSLHLMSQFTCLWDCVAFMSMWSTERAVTQKMT